MTDRPRRVLTHAAQSSFAYLLATLLLSLLTAVPVLAQGPPAGAAGDKKADKKKGPKPYDEVITEDATSDPGLFIVHRLEDDVYFEIPVDELGKDMVWVTQLAETQAGYAWAGMPVGNRVVRWEQRGDRVLLRDIKYDIRANVDDPIQIAVEATSVAPIIHVFKVEAYGKDKAPVIKATPIFVADKPEFSAKDLLGGMSGIDKDRTFVEGVKSFPENVETRVLATYKPDRKPQAPGQGRGFPTAVPRDRRQSGVTVELHHSMVKLPENPMKPRVFDERVGFFTRDYTDFGDDSDHAVKDVSYITRWRLEKKDPNKKISEPVKPIIWYVSREVPAKWQPYVLKGIDAWQPAFESAGFKDAIIGKLAPTPQEDPDWDPEDARYTTIRWLPSAVPNAFGPHVHDPRTGEILEADVRMFHNVIKLLRDWYFVQAGASDPRAQQLPMPDDLMGELISFVVAHEVGHSLGFPHNMKASSNYTIDQLRDAEFTKENGTAPSIMDYARFNYVAQPGDGAALMPAIGRYDHFATEWGYTQFPEGADEKAELEKIVARQIDDPMLRFGDPNPIEDPTQQTEDLGADAVAATRLGLKNLERIADFLVKATSRPGEDYALLENMHNALLGQWRREMGHVTSVVGGVEQVNLYYGDAAQRFFPIDVERQKEAVQFLNENAFQRPELFLDPDVLGRLESSGVADRVLAAQRGVLGLLMFPGRLKRMSALAEQGEGYAPADFLSDVTAGLWSELDSGAPSVGYYRRNLQRAHVNMLTAALDTDDAASDVSALARGELTALRDRATAAAEQASDKATKHHLMDVGARIQQALDQVMVKSDEDNGGNGRRRAFEFETYLEDKSCLIH